MPVTQATAKKITATAAVCVLAVFLLTQFVPSALRLMEVDSGTVDLAESIMNVTLLIAGACFGLSIFMWTVSELTKKEGKK